MKSILAPLLTLPACAGTYSLTIAPTTEAVFVELPLPPGALVERASDGGTFDAERGVLKWGPLLPAPETVTFTLRDEPNDVALNPTAEPALVSVTSNERTRADGDNDGLPDDFEALYQFVEGVDEGGLDHDGDGLPTLAEARLGTNPRDAGESLSTLSLERGGDSLTWVVSPALPDAVTIEAATSPEALTWIPLEVDIRRTSDTATVTIPLTGRLPVRFFRLRF